MSRATVEHETLAFVPERVLLQGWEVSYQACEQAGASGLVALVQCAKPHLCRCYVFSFIAPLFLGGPSLCCRLCHKVWSVVTEPLLTKRCIMCESSAIQFWIIYRVLMVRDRGQDGAEDAGIRWHHEKRGGGAHFIQTSSWTGSLSETQPVKSCCFFFISLQKAEQVRWLVTWNTFVLQGF